MKRFAVVLGKGLLGIVLGILVVLLGVILWKTGRPILEPLVRMLLEWLEPWLVW